MNFSPLISTFVVSLHGQPRAFHEYHYLKMGHYNKIECGDSGSLELFTRLYLT